MIEIGPELASLIRSFGGVIIICFIAWVMFR